MVSNCTFYIDRELTYLRDGITTQDFGHGAKHDRGG